MCAFKLLPVCLGVIAISSAVGVPMDGGEKPKSSGDEKALGLKLELVKRRAGDLRQTKLRLTATNTSKRDIVLDTKLVVGFGLKFETDIGSKGVFVSEDRDVTAQQVKWLKPPPRKKVRMRFAKLAPGRSFTRNFDLSQPIRTVQQGHATLKNKTHKGFYYEADVRYRLPRRAKKLFIRVSYVGKVWFFAEQQFEWWFGMSVGKSGVWQGQAVSNTVAVEK